MATLDDLEAQLREGLDRGIDRDIVTVYGDQLQALGDPRGELIAIDLEIEHSGATPELARRRAELVEIWLGQQQPNGAIRCGFIDLDATSAEPVAQVRLAFGGRAARFVRSVTAVGPPKLLRETIAAIAEAPRPFLSRVTLRQWSEKDAPTIGRDEAAAFARATPHLQCLEIDARRLFSDLPHPAVRRLRLSGFDAIGSLLTGKLVLPELSALDLAIHCHLATTRSAPPDELFERLGTNLPKLTTLDVSRNEPGYLDPHTLGGDTQLFPFLPKLACRGRLISLTVPPFTTPETFATMRSALAAMPELRDLAIVRVPKASRSLMTKNFARPELAIRFST
ncbi:MAG: hypothetical protein H0V17_20710 [Deltaproteobacteria bacterium]|nr:hypothetical protein [Deltaproteobacteria bacterium]